MTASRAPKFVAIAAIVWNLIGIASFLGQANIDTVELAKTDPKTAGILDSMPLWAWASFAVSVFGGLLGAVLLLRKRKLAVPVYAVSLAAIVLLFGHSFLATDMLAAEGWTSTLVPALIFLLGLAQWLYARALAAKAVLL